MIAERDKHRFMLVDNDDMKHYAEYRGFGLWRAICRETDVEVEAGAIRSVGDKHGVNCFACMTRG